ncbi:hypothetical protein JVU11DRAFT_4826 [Chiua virens]|nr:hypothetical protein JVU11DRAFT_4826 [Chiua virens]
MDDNLAKLLSAESDLLVALESGAQMVASYNRTWSQLLDVFDTASKAGSVGKETMSLVHTVACHILKIANCYVHVKHREEDWTTQLRADYDAVIQRMEALDINDLPGPSRSDSSPNVGSPTLLPTPASDTGHLSPPFLAPAYRWLLDNLHNPYPTADVKKRLADSSSCQVSSINSWFTNTRRRIGWTNLCREHFSNCRADMLDAAYRALVKEDPQRILSAEIRHFFVAIKVAAESLYPSTFTRSAFVEDLDVMAKHITSGGAGKSAQVEQANPMKTVRDSYPSPDRSTTGTPAPVLDNSPTDGSEVLYRTSRSALPSQAGPSSVYAFPTLLRRISLPHPQAQMALNIQSVDGSPELSPAQSVRPETSIISPSRKRRLSEVDTIGLSKPRGAMPASRPQIASDPSPSNPNDEYSVEDWFNTNFDALFAMPPPVEAARPDSSSLWDVELFKDYSIPGNSKHASNCAPAPIDTHIPVPTDFTDLDHLLQSLGGHTFTAPSETETSPEIPLIPNSTSLNSSIPDPSQISIDWSSLLNSTEAHQPTIYPTFPQYPIEPQPLPEIDLSMLQLPHVIPTANSQVDITSKRAKLQQFHVMQEALRQMERELQSEGVLA